MEKDVKVVSPHSTTDTAIPGTHLLIDLDREAPTSRDGASGDIILIPTPTSDPDDPLNWSPKRKFVASCCWASYVLFLGINNSNLYSILVPFSDASGLPVATLNAGTGYLFLLAGTCEQTTMYEIGAELVCYRMGGILLVTICTSIR